MACLLHCFSAPSGTGKVSCGVLRSLHGLVCTLFDHFEVFGLESCGFQQCLVVVCGFQRTRHTCMLLDLMWNCLVVSQTLVLYKAVSSFHTVLIFTLYYSVALQVLIVVYCFLRWVLHLFCIRWFPIAKVFQLLSITWHLTVQSSQHSYTTMWVCDYFAIR